MDTLFPGDDEVIDGVNGEALDRHVHVEVVIAGAAVIVHPKDNVWRVPVKHTVHVVNIGRAVRLHFPRRHSSGSDYQRFLHVFLFLSVLLLKMIATSG